MNRILYCYFLISLSKFIKESNKFKFLNILRNKKVVITGGPGSGKTEIIKELEKNERIDKNLLRYVTIRVKKFDLEENYFGKEEDEEIKKGKKK